MIIMLNGSFGVGKSSVAEELCRRMSNTMLYDPEVVGTALCYMTKGVLSAEEQTGDFQDIAIWPTMTVVPAAQLYRQYRRSLVVPMTLVNMSYLRFIRDGLAAIFTPLYHFCLVAPLQTIEQRLYDRDEDPSWAVEKARQYVPLFSDPHYGVHISTEGVSVAGVVMQIEEYVAANPEGSYQSTAIKR